MDQVIVTNNIKIRNTPVILSYIILKPESICNTLLIVSIIINNGLLD